jgi:hypothetical protein
VPVVSAGIKKKVEKVFIGSFVKPEHALPLLSKDEDGLESLLRKGKFRRRLLTKLVVSKLEPPEIQ